MHVVYQRIGELYSKLQSVGLNEDECIELDHCMKANVELCWKYAELMDVFCK